MKIKMLLVLLSVFLMAIVLTAAASAGSADHSSFGMYWIWEPPFSPDPVGTVSLVRHENGITGNVRTSLANDGTGDYHGVVVTLWIAIYNEPENCFTTPCGKADAFTNPAAVPDIVYAGGRVVGGSEKVNISFSLNEGDNSGSIFGEGSPGLIDSRNDCIGLRSFPFSTPARMAASDARSSPRDRCGLEGRRSDGGARAVL